MNGPKQGGQAGTSKDTADQQRLRNTIAQEIENVMVRHGVGGAVFLVSMESSAWRFVLPKWAGLQREGNALRLRINSKTPEAKARGDSTLHYIAMLRDMAMQCATVFHDLFATAENALGDTAIEHKRFPGFGVGGGSDGKN